MPKKNILKVQNEIGMQLFDHIENVRARIDAACARCGRSTAEITLVAVTKTVPAGIIRQAYDLGLSVIGENRVQDGWDKFAQLGDLPLEWHLIGHLQTNKVRRALQFVRMIESVDSLHLAAEINRVATESGSRIKILLEVNTSGEPSKFGVKPEQSAELAQQVAALPNLELAGLMTVGIWSDDQTRIRAGFASLRQIRDRLQLPGLGLPHLSMGMSDDFEIAIEEGATFLRIGRALFGERK